MHAAGRQMANNSIVCVICSHICCEVGTRAKELEFAALTVCDVWVADRATPEDGRCHKSPRYRPRNVDTRE